MDFVFATICSILRFTKLDNIFIMNCCRLAEQLPTCKAVLGPWSHNWPDEALPGRDEGVPGRDEALPDRDETLPVRDETLPGRDETLPGRDETLTGRDGQPMEDIVCFR